MNFKNILKTTYFAFAIFLISFSTSTANDLNTKEILKAMKDELQREMKELKLENLERPYYIEYTLRSTHANNISATLGNIVDNNSKLYNTLNVGVRVGNYEFDNSNFFDVGFSFFGSTDDEENYTRRTLPVDLNYDVLRRELWLATDAAYKQSSEVYAKKTASLKNIIRKDTIPDFSKINPTVSIDTINTPDFDFLKFKKLVQDLSDIFTSFPKIFVSKVSTEYIPVRTYYVNSEGMEYVKDEMQTGLEVVAYTQTEKGIPLAEHYSVYSQNPNNLPKEDSLRKAINELAVKLTYMTKVNTLDDSYNGPVLFEDQASTEIFSQVFAPNLIAQRQPLSEGFSIGGNDKSMAFQKKIGGRVLPEFLSVFDVPNEAKYKKTELLGYYIIDDEGLKPNRITLVENGYLKTLLNERIPVKRIYKSNAHKRNGAAMYSNLVVFPDPIKTLSDKELKEKLLQLVNQRELPFGIIIRKVMNQNIQATGLMSETFGQSMYFNSQKGIPVLEAYKIYPNGMEELIRSVEINSVSPQSFKDIIYAGKTAYVQNLLAPAVISPFMTGGSSYVGASINCPSLLFEDMEINAIDKDTPKPPYITKP
ncbi:MAG: hypothetical protein A2X64_06755 [Ignavibacteria bacterium GWF2_33_9]|nr:MAG: hypothetical protein A2X64_06755 [Ignavibacteria bacterium GWF2_33_9]